MSESSGEKKVNEYSENKNWTLFKHICFEKQGTVFPEISSICFK